MDVAAGAAVLLHVFQQFESVSHADEVVHGHGHDEEGYFEHQKLRPCEVFDEAVDMMAGEVETEVLDETKRNGP